MLIQRLKQCRQIYLLAVVLLTLSLMLIFFHQHKTTSSYKNCQICKIANDISSSKTLEQFFPTLPKVVTTLDAVDIFSPAILSLLLSHDSRASPIPHLPSHNQDRIDF